MKREVKVGNLTIGGGHPIVIQSMTNTKTTDIDGTIAQILALHRAGCQLVRCSVPDEASACALKEIVAQSPIPVVADIHFRSKLACMSADAGAAKIRINPGNIGSHDKVRYLADYLKERSIPIRIGVNGGSLDPKYADMPLDRALAESTMEHVRLLEDCGFYDIILSAKASDVPTMVRAYRMLDKMCDYPLHLGVTEAGTYTKGLVKSAVGIGALIVDGIGDTIRVSLTDDPVKEIYAAAEILKACGKYPHPYAEIVSCPTCARTCIPVQELADRVDAMCADLQVPIKVAVMGCVVNGIGESKGADVGIAGGPEKSVLFAHGKQIALIPNEEILPRLRAYIDQWVKERQ